MAALHEVASNKTFQSINQSINQSITQSIKQIIPHIDNKVQHSKIINMGKGKVEV